MCHGHPHYHKCQHTSVKWLYCPEAAFDMDTGYETPCSHPIYSAPQPSSANCPLQHCHYKALRGSWTCCQCGHDTNTQGWCSGKTHASHLGSWAPVGLQPASWQSCGHGCCGQCIRNISSKVPTPELAFTDICQSKHRSKRVHNYEFISIPSVHEGSSDSPSGGSGFDMEIDYSKTSKSTSGKKKGQRRSRRRE